MMRALLIFFLMVATPASAERPVRFSDTAEDSVGSRLAYHIKQKLAASQLFRPVSQEDYPHYNLDLVTIDPDNRNRDAGQRTVYSIVLSFETKEDLPAYLDNWVGYCGSDIPAQCAENVLAKVLKSAETFEDAIRARD